MGKLPKKADYIVVKIYPGLEEYEAVISYEIRNRHTTRKVKASSVESLVRKVFGVSV